MKYFLIKYITGDYRQANISGLTPSTQYEVQVAAVTVDTGPFTNTINASTSGMSIIYDQLIE